MTKQTYAEPGLYDIAFSYRDYDREAEVLERCFEAISQTQLTSVLELACGPARHLLPFVVRDIHCQGLDLSSDMCRYAETLIEPAKVLEGDMREFELGRQYDLVLLLINSVSHLLEERDLTTHLRSVRRHLTTNGLYLIEATRDGTDEPPGESQWRNERDSDYVDLTWSWTESTNTVTLNGMYQNREVQFSETFPMRRWSTEELIKFASAAGLTLVGCTGDFSADGAELVRECRQLPNPTTMHPCLIFAPT